MTSPLRLRHLAAVLAGVGLIACAQTNEELEEADAAELTASTPVTFTNQWDAEHRASFYRTSEARPLPGVAFAGYLLHNGSVPNLYELLLPPKERSKVFHVGNREYDPVRLGFVSNVRGANTTEFDTRLPGSSNVGHEYGTRLAESDRWALIEFLKTL